MSEDEIIHLIFNRIRICKSAKWFIHAFEYILFMTGKTVAAGPAVTEPEGNPWMKHAEKPLDNPSLLIVQFPYHFLTLLMHILLNHLKF